MKRSTTLVAAGATAGAVLALVAPVLVAGSAGAETGVRLRFVETSTAFHFVDAVVPAADGQAGDVGIFESSLSKAGVTIGSLEGHCLQMRADGSLDDCDVTVTVGKSSYRMAGPFDPVKGGALTITGGTGAWVGAGGTDTIVNQPDGTAIHTVVIKL